MKRKIKKNPAKEEPHSILRKSRLKNIPDKSLSKINTSIHFDKRLYAQDIAGSIVHCLMLIQQKIITKNIGEKIISGLKQIQKEIKENKFTFDENLEDIHMHIENRLHQIIGDDAGYLHTARSRNDQVATDFRIWIRETIDAIVKKIKNYQNALVNRAEEHHKTILPGLTHLQNAQPITFGHHLLAYFEMAERDIGRFNDCRKRLNESPLGSGALAGTAFPIDRKFTSKKLNFQKPMRNSLDAVSARDFAIEFLACCSISSIHMSRLAEEIVLWMSEPFNFINLSDSFSTGSSMLPQKRNPDAAELIRSKPARIIGNLNTLMIILKGLPLSYSKDLQEDKEPTFDAADTMILCLDAMTGMIQDMKINKQSMYESASKGYPTATDLADWLVQKTKMPFRKAYNVTGKIVALAEKLNCPLNELPLEEMKKIEPKVTKDVFALFDLKNSVASRKSEGGTSPSRVTKVIKSLKK